ncbi:MAG: DUF2062 domain-containing protein [Gammaproteobacteria bacterium]|nr:DUF2062 domain-containing protein [Gammaproteobacteria bacterium]
MPKKTIQRLLPSAAQLQENSALNWISPSVDSRDVNADGKRRWISNPQLWHLNRRSISGGVAVGLFIGWLPIPMQMLVAAFLASVLHVNLLIAVLLVWISNPLTLPALLYAAYVVGSLLFGWEAATQDFEPSITWLANSLGEVWQPILAGCLFLGALSAVTGFVAVRVLWRINLVKRWQERRVRIAMREQTR